MTALNAVCVLIGVVLALLVTFPVERHLRRRSERERLSLDRWALLCNPRVHCSTCGSSVAPDTAAWTHERGWKCNHTCRRHGRTASLQVAP